MRTRAVRMVLEHESDRASRWSAIASNAAKIGCTAETLRPWVKQAETESGRADRSDEDLASRLTA